MTELTVAMCGRDAARFAVLNWHYSQTMPSGKLIYVGAWEDGEYIGAVLFGRGANDRLGRLWDLDQTDVCELVRVALRPHESPTSAIVARAIKLLHESNPGLRLIISFADMAQGHIGTLYQAGNWVYTGASYATKTTLFGVPVHRRTISSKYGNARLEWLREHVDPNAEVVADEPKHRYVMPLDRAIRRRVLRSAVPYPAVEGSIGAAG